MATTSTALCDTKHCPSTILIPKIHFVFNNSNIVGYGPSTLNENGLTAGASFLNIGADQMIDLTQIEVTGYDKEEGSDADVQIQTLNEFSQTVNTYFWVDVDAGEDGVWFGWYAVDEDGEYAPLAKGEVTIQPGEGLWTFCTGDGFSLRSNGEVPIVSDVETKLQENGLSVVNPTPVAVDLTKTYVGGYDKEEGSDADVQIQTLNEFAQTVETYFWVDVDAGEDGVWYGWYAVDEDGEYAALAVGDVVVQPGAGLWTFCTGDGFTMNWPKVDVK